MTRKTDMIVTRERHALEIDNNVMYAFGGENDDNPLNKCEKYYVKSDSWLEFENLPAYRYLLSSTKHQNSVYIVNGDDNSMFVYDLATFHFSTRTLPFQETIFRTWKIISSDSTNLISIF